MVSFLQVSPPKPKTLPHTCHMPHPSNPPSNLYQDRYNTIPDAYRFSQKPSHYYFPTDFPGSWHTCKRHHRNVSTHFTTSDVCSHVTTKESLNMFYSIALQCQHPPICSNFYNSNRHTRRPKCLLHISKLHLTSIYWTTKCSKNTYRNSNSTADSQQTCQGSFTIFEILEENGFWIIIS